MISSGGITEVVILFATGEKLGEAVKEHSNIQAAVRRTMSFAPALDGTPSVQDMGRMNAEQRGAGQGVEASPAASKQVGCVTAPTQGRAGVTDDAKPGFCVMNVHTILGALAGTKQMAEAFPAEVREGDAEAAQPHVLLEQGLEDMNKTEKQDIDEATLEMASTEAVLAEAERTSPRK